VIAKSVMTKQTHKHLMRVIAVTQPGVDIEARWVKKGGQSVFGYKQHTLVDHNGLVMAR
jgi:IS5 family transposase